MPAPTNDQSDNKSKLKSILASPYFLPTATILPAVLMFLYQRRIVKQPTQAAENLAKRIREGGIGVAIDPETRKMNPAMAMLRYGTPHVGPEETIPGHIKTVLSHQPTEAWEGPSRVIGNVPAEAILPKGPDKLYEVQMLRSIVGKYAAPRSHHAATYIPGFAALPAEAKLKMLQDNAKRIHPNGYVIKLRLTEGKTTPATKSIDLVNEYNRLFEYNLREPRPEWAEVAKDYGMKSMSLADAMSMMKDDATLAGSLIHKSSRDLEHPLLAAAIAQNPKAAMVQEFIHNIGEWRIHVFDGRIIRSATVPRHDRMAGAMSLLGYKSDLTKQIEDRVEKEILAHMRPEHLKGRSMALDVMMRPDGSPVIIEMNPFGWSGFLKGKGVSAIPAAVTMNRYMSELAGQKTIPLAAASALATGAVGAGLGSVAQSAASPEKSIYEY